METIITIVDHYYERTLSIMTPTRKSNKSIVNQKPKTTIVTTKTLVGKGVENHTSTYLKRSPRDEVEIFMTVEQHVSDMVKGESIRHTF